VGNKWFFKVRFSMRVREHGEASEVGRAKNKQNIRSRAVPVPTKNLRGSSTYEHRPTAYEDFWTILIPLSSLRVFELFIKVECDPDTEVLPDWAIWLHIPWASIISAQSLSRSLCNSSEAVSKPTKSYVDHFGWIHRDTGDPSALV
jgi:hypothetical protein